MCVWRDHENGKRPHFGFIVAYIFAIIHRRQSHSLATFEGEQLQTKVAEKWSLLISAHKRRSGDQLNLFGAIFELIRIRVNGPAITCGE